MNVRWTPPRGAVLVLAPHPDDETLGCGGTLHLHARRGDRVKVVFVTDGAAGDPEGHFRGRDYTALRKAEARRAAADLGLSELEFWDFPDGRLGRARDLGDRLSACLDAERPDVLYRPSTSDPHPDHRALALGVEAAARKGKRRFKDCRYEVGYLQRPSAVVDVGANFARKLSALRRYRSQLRYRDYVASAARAALWRGLFLGRGAYGEAFEVT